MTTTPPEAPQQPPGPTGYDGPRVTGDEMRDLTRLRRSSTDKHVAGVAGGLGRHLDIDPIIIRVAFVVLAFFGGAGVLAYGALWLLVPDDEDNVTIDLDNRTRNVALIGVGVLAALLTVGDAFGGSDWFPWPILIIGVIAWLLISRRDRRRERLARRGDWVAPPGTPAGTTPAPAGAGGTTAPTRWAGGTTSMTGWAGTAPAYDTPGWVAPGQAPPGYGATYLPPRRPRDPRKTGPLLFWFTLALIALAEGTLGILDLAGLPILDSAYPALALGITALMLLVGAFYGRAGGLILLGLIATVATTGATVASQVDGGQVDVRPTSAAAVQDEYSLDTGEVIVDLSDVRDIQALDGRSLEVHAGIGRVEVILPDGLDITVDGRVDGPGHLALLGGDEGGVGLEDRVTHDGGVDAPQLDLEAWVGIGEVEVTTR
jgi:phage shock protein PspC (stress-responsive transcriptional regulator)